MYSLYWLSRPDPPPPLPLHAPSPLSLPDVVVAVGEAPGSQHQFAAHRAVLAANSGYFKAALGHDPPPSCVAVTGVTAEALAPLLGYMYTGYLDVGGDNIYDVLLATHYLHMPRALELCWNFLRAHPPAAAPTLVKPIPGLPWRPALAPALGPTMGPAQAPSSHMVLPTAEHSPFRAPHHSANPSHSPASEEPEQPAKQPDSPGRRPASSSPAPRTRSPQSSPAAVGGSTAASTDVADTSATSATTTTPTPRPTPSAITGKVIVDVACCDGPVRFHRVLNASYGCPDEPTPPDPDENMLHQRLHVPGAAQLRRSRANRLAAESSAAGLGPSSAAGGEYTCLYCNHTFKSHYCYQKHARRHLNPLAPKEVAAVAPSAARAPARPLDMNVQYYPCKTCGSKFPSYYFVHKHRKLCHSAEESEAAKPPVDDSG